MTGRDVLILQWLLNVDPKTRITGQGAGSPGLETSYFGQRTKEAVIRFQNLYTREVLFPLGLKTGTGFVGHSTMATLLRLGVCASPPRVSSTAENTSLDHSSPTTTESHVDSVTVKPPTMESITAPASSSSGYSGSPQVNRPSSYVVSPGDKLSVSGIGFTLSGNALHIGTLVITDLSKSVTGTLEAVVPNSAPKGKFDLFVSNANGESNKSFLIIVDPGTAPPLVKSFSPVRGGDGTEIRVVGEGFTKENNEIYFGAIPQKGISSADGKSLTFTLSMGIPGFSTSTPTSTSTTPIWFYVVNANGISDNNIFTLML